MKLHEFDGMISQIKMRTRKTEAQISEDMGYIGNYISTIRTRARAGQEIPSKFISQIQGKYGHLYDPGTVISKTPIQDVSDHLKALLSRQAVQGYYLAQIWAKLENRPLPSVLEEMNAAEQDAVKRQAQAK